MKNTEILPLEDSVRMTIEDWLLLVGLIVILLGLILTFSRATWLSVALGIITLGVFVFWQKEQEIRIRFFTIIAVFGLAGAVFGFVLCEQIFPRFDTSTIEREGSVSERITSLQDAEILIKEHSLIGVGAGNFTAEIIERNEGGLMGEMGRPIWSIQPAHNVFALIMADLGIIGFLLFAGFLFFVLKSVIRNPQSVILITLIPILLLDHWLWTSHFGLLFFFLLLGFLFRQK